MNTKKIILNAVLFTTLLASSSWKIAAAKADSTDLTEKATVRKTEAPRRICNIISGTTTRPAYMGPLLNFSSYGNWRLGLFGPSVDILPTAIGAPLTVENYYSIGKPEDDSIPNATKGGISNSDRVAGQRQYLGNADYIPDTRTKAETGGMIKVIDAVFN